MAPRPILIVTHCAVHRDAIGNDVWLQAEVLRHAGHQVTIFANLCDDFYARRLGSYAEAQEILRRPDSILIYHHSCYTPNIDRFFDEARGAIVVKYHNITPAEYFAHNKSIQQELFLARQQSQFIVTSGKVACYLGDSSYNNQELIQLGADPDKCRVLAPFHFVEDFRSAGLNPQLQAKLGDGRFNVLCVSRLMRHKGQIELVETIDHYLGMYDDKIRLCIVGRLENAAYGEALAHAINSRRLSHYVEIYQDVNLRDLHTFYTACHAFSMMSEHEGFGVPILEAQFHGLPIIGLDRAAVRETMGSAAFVFQDKDPAIFAAGLRRLKTDLTLAEYLRIEGRQNYSRFSKDKLATALMALVQHI